MKTIGLLGGMSWESSVSYYQIINRAVARELGGLHSARLVLYSVDFEPVERLQHANRWAEAGAVLADAACALQRAGADFLVLCTNTMHRVVGEIEAAVTIPLLHVVDPTGEAIRASGVTRVGLLGTRFTMEQDFYRGRLEQRYGLTVLVPGAASRERVHEVIYAELCRGVISDASRVAFRQIVADLAEQGAEAVVLGCTEIGLLLSPDDVNVPLFDTTVLHAEAAAARALGDPNPDALEVRPATADDAEAIARLHARSWRESYRGAFDDAFLDGDLVGERLAVWRDRLANPPAGQLVLVAADRDGLAGFVCAYAEHDPEWGSFVDNLHVAGERKRSGVGAALMSRAGAWLHANHPGRGVYLWVLEMNGPARRFYERLGARNAGTQTMETHGGATVRSCRYAWPDARTLADA